MAGVNIFWNDDSVLINVYMVETTILIRNCVSEGPDHRERGIGSTSALQAALMKFADRNSDYIINPAVGTEFDDCTEAYEYYNLYSWECGFGIKCGKKRYSMTRDSLKLPQEKRYQLGQEFNCSCSVSATICKKIMVSPSFITCRLEMPAIDD